MRKLMRWAMLTVGLLIVVAAVTVPLVQKARGDVAFCLSCHVMSDVGKTHATSFHRDVATCSDCHTGSLLQKYMDGTRHIVANATGIYPDPITIHEGSKAVVAGQCLQCHADTSLHARQKQEKGESCLECHSGHAPRAIDLPELVRKKQSKP